MHQYLISRLLIHFFLFLLVLVFIFPLLFFCWHVFLFALLHAQRFFFLQTSFTELLFRKKKNTKNKIFRSHKANTMLKLIFVILFSYSSHCFYHCTIFLSFRTSLLLVKVKKKKKESKIWYLLCDSSSLYFHLRRKFVVQEKLRNMWRRLHFTCLAIILVHKNQSQI